MFTERVLLESARRTLTLSAARRAAVLNALLAEAARLRVLSLRRMELRANWEQALARLFSPRVLGPFGSMAVLAVLVAGYFLFGGARISANASLSGRAVLSEQRYGPFGLEWSIEHSLDDWDTRALHRGDDIVAFSPITITYADGSKTIAAAGTRLSVLPNEDGLTLLNGEIANFISPSKVGAVKFRVESATGTMLVKGTTFRVRTERDASVSEFTDEGKVGVTNGTDTIDVFTGEQVQLKIGETLRAELQVPRVVFNTQAKDRVASSTPNVTFTSRIFPGATLIVEEAHSGKQFARYVAGSDGLIVAQLPKIIDKASLQFSQVDAGNRRSALSKPVEIVIDQTPPMLAVTQVKRVGNTVTVAGRTEVRAAVHIDGKPIKVMSDGTFKTEVDVAASTTSITIAAVDEASNVTSIVQTLDQ